MINLKTKSGRLVPLTVLIVLDIAVPLRNTTNERVRQLPYLKGLLLAHPVTTNENFRISLLNGADHYWDIVEDDIIRGDGPTAVGSQLGYLFSGPLPNTQFTNILHVGAVNNINCDLQKFWTLETAGTEPQTENSKHAHQKFLNTYSQNYITCLEDGSYCVPGFPGKGTICHYPPISTTANRELAHLLTVFLRPLTYCICTMTSSKINFEENLLNQ